ncbi:hypothetical protein ACSQ67_020824 [Phaseolus vulgaris]
MGQLCPQIKKSRCVCLNSKILGDLVELVETSSNLNDRPKSLEAHSKESCQQAHLGNKGDCGSWVGADAGRVWNAEASDCGMDKSQAPFPVRREEGQEEGKGGDAVGLCNFELEGSVPGTLPSVEQVIEITEEIRMKTALNLQCSRSICVWWFGVDGVHNKDPPRDRGYHVNYNLADWQGKSWWCTGRSLRSKCTTSLSHPGPCCGSFGLFTSMHKLNDPAGLKVKFCYCKDKVESLRLSCTITHNDGSVRDRLGRFVVRCLFSMMLVHSLDVVPSGSSYMFCSSSKPAIISHKEE